MVYITLQKRAEHGVAITVMKCTVRRAMEVGLR